jgi:hypothetical protein
LDLINHLHRQNHFLLSHLADPNTTTPWHQGWKSVTDVGLIGALATQYKNYITTLQVGHIRLIDREDELVWQKDPSGTYTPKLGYIALSMDLFQQFQIMVVERTLEIKMSTKSQNLPMGGPKWKSSNMGKSEKATVRRTEQMSSCHSENETTYHLLISCPFTQRVWTEASTSIGQNMYMGRPRLGTGMGSLDT